MAASCLQHRGSHSGVQGAWHSDFDATVKAGNKSIIPIQGYLRLLLPLVLAVSTSLRRGRLRYLRILGHAVKSKCSNLKQYHTRSTFKVKTSADMRSYILFRGRCRDSAHVLAVRPRSPRLGESPSLTDTKYYGIRSIFCY